MQILDERDIEGDLGNMHCAKAFVSGFDPLCLDLVYAPWRLGFALAGLGFWGAGGVHLAIMPLPWWVFA